MSFRNIFKQHAPKKSAISRTAEREFERETKRMEQLDENTKKIYKDMKRCTESQGAQSKCETKMANNLLTGPLCREDEALRHMVEKWSHTSRHLEALTDEINASSQKTVMDPMKKLGTVFPSLQQSIKKRELSLQEYNRCQAKVDKYTERERTGANIVKLEASKKARQAAKEDYDAQNKALMEDMPTLYEGRIDYFQPSFQGLIKSQIKYYTDAHQAYSELAGKLSKGKGDPVESEDEYMQQMQQKLAEIRALSITVDD